MKSWTFRRVSWRQERAMLLRSSGREHFTPLGVMESEGSSLRGLPRLHLDREDLGLSLIRCAQ